MELCTRYYGSTLSSERRAGHVILYTEVARLEDCDVVPYPLFLVLSNAFGNPGDVPNLL